MRRLLSLSIIPIVSLTALSGAKIMAQAPGASAEIREAGSPSRAARRSASPGVRPGSQKNAARPPERLPQSITPSLYNLSIEPDIKHGTFTGEESIYINLAARTNRIILHSVDLKINGLPLIFPGAKSDQGTPLSVQQSGDMMTLTLPEPVDPGEYKLFIKFAGKMNDKLCGFYRATISDDRGGVISIATTQMEPSDARRMFPCFDEPAMKAVFKMRVTVNGGETAISNSPVESETRADASGKRTITFAPTPKMSTYLVTLIVGPFKSTGPVVASGVPIRVWALNDQHEMGIYARTVAARLMPYFISYFGTPYPARKLDLIAIPEFQAGAMENLGAITFREEALLLSEKAASVENKYRTASFIGHEMAHLWFGDLVTMKWWDDLWLNEAFATWMSVKALDFMRPDWKPWEHFAMTRLYAMDTDSLRSSRPIHATVSNAAQAIEMFDGITYNKGASILRMLETYVGEKVFQKGVQKYIKAHSFGNAATDDLWDAISAASGKPIKEIMRTWVYSAGFPVVTLGKDKSGATVISQKRFFMDGATMEDGPIWSIPLSLMKLSQEDGKRSRSDLLLSESRLMLSGINEEEAVLLNAGGNGYYRVRYSPQFIHDLLERGISNLSPVERLTLLSDQWALTFAGLSPVSSYFRLTRHFADETDPEVIKELVGQLQALSGLIRESDRPRFEHIVNERLGAISGRLGWTSSADEKDPIRFARTQVIETMGTIGQNKETIFRARKLFDDYLKKEDSIDPNLVSPITAIVAYNGDEKTYEEIYKLWKTTNKPEVRIRNLMSLTLFREPELIDRTLKMTLSKEIRLQDAPYLLSNVLSTESGRRPAWKFVKENWKRIKETYPTPAIPHVISAADSLMTAADEKDVRDFLSKNPVPAGARKISQTLERLHNRVKFHERLKSETASL